MFFFGKKPQTVNVVSIYIMSLDCYVVRWVFLNVLQLSSVYFGSHSGHMNEEMVGNVRGYKNAIY